MICLVTSSNTGPGGVKNLRAIFETKSSDLSTSPPSRGRSPNGSISSVHNRPVSKVRASFVAVERPGEAGAPLVWGLQKISDTKMESSSVLGSILKGSPFESPGKRRPAKVRTLDGAVEQNEVPADDSDDLAAAMIKRMQQGIVEETPTVELQTTATAEPVRPPPTRRVPPKPNSPETTEKSPTSPTEPGSFVKPRGGVAKIQDVIGSANAAREHRRAAAEQAEKAEEKEQKPVTPTTTNFAARPRGGVAKIQGVTESANQARELRAAAATKTTIGDADTSKEQPKPATFPKPRGGVAKIKGVMDSAHKAQQYRLAASATKADTDKPTTVDDKTTSPVSISDPRPRKEPRLSLRPKSPTRPAKVSASLMAGTAASAAKKGAVLEEPKQTDRKSSAKLPPRVANATTASSLAKKSSRASLNPSEAPKARVSNAKPADEGFLARMTRPTASSTQKAHEKVQAVSPPRTRRASSSKKVLGSRSTTKTVNMAEKRPEERKESEEHAAQEVASNTNAPATNGIDDAEQGKVHMEQDDASQQAEKEA